MNRIVVAGGGLAAARVCERLRAKGHDGELLVLCAEPHPPYDRPPLTKAALLEERDTTLRTDFELLEADLRLGVAATGLAPDRDVVRTAEGEIPFSTLVIATGSAPVPLPGTGPQHVVRTAQDAARLRAGLRPGAHVVLAGAGWIGGEVATAALHLGCRVTCVEPGPAPLAAALGAEVGALFLPWWSDVDLRLGVGVTEVTATGVRLGDGSHLPADVVVAGVGVRPQTDWLSGSGVEVDRGVVVDEHLRTTRPGVYAVGDVAARWSVRWNKRLRVEHWDDARTGPDVAAAVILGGDAGPDPLPVHDPVPYFWSDQFGHKIQYVGQHGAEDSVVVRGRGSAKWGAAWLAPDGTLNAHLSVDQPKQMIHARAAIDAGAKPDPGSLADPGTAL
ncbi:FAD-dependent oxidoreductase [Saccharopolyspora sp. TS4A08]|uniref:FAD-dependent oxidoreductase n=1 Tax=Saccharopolyspora ipomoeae TaxID=3042027 RepID=A0ABT6PIF0_9PSEU|nr:FAD-dependent oxidoreductase [Saccharopolyspora sp. TS4A08]MDI2027729.1 FAD-dependent oxidoreductase [Saccharopolyspora sp. TS4A08]